MTLRESRIEKGLTQEECGRVLGVPLRTYVRYENEERKAKTIKHRFMMEKTDQLWIYQ